MKAIVVTITLFILSGIAFAGEPRLVADPPAETTFTKYQVEVDGEAQPTVTAQADGTMLFDVSHLPLGPTYTFKARGCTAWGQWSPWSAPLKESSALPSSVKNLKLASE